MRGTPEWEGAPPISTAMLHGTAHVLRLHSSEPTPRYPVYRGHQFLAEALGGASQRPGLLLRQNLRCLSTGPCRILRAPRRGDRARETIEKMEARLEDGADRGGER